MVKFQNLEKVNNSALASLSLAIDDGQHGVNISRANRALLENIRLGRLSLNLGKLYRLNESEIYIRYGSKNDLAAISCLYTSGFLESRKSVLSFTGKYWRFLAMMDNQK